MSMDSKGRTITPLHLNLGINHVFITKTDVMNKELSEDAEMANVQKITVRSLENDSANRKVIVNAGKPDEIKLSYDFTGLALDEAEAKREAAFYNRKQIEKIQSLFLE